MELNRLLRSMFLALSLPLAGYCCSPAGHTFVAAAAMGKLRQSPDPEVRKLAAVLDKYRGVVYWAAEGPDTIQKARSYQASHWFPLYTVNYEHPERFDLAAAQPFFTACMKGAYTASYGVSAEDIVKHGIQLAKPADDEWNEVSLAFACGYITHLLSDYFCHAPAKVWWDASPELQKAILATADSKSYGVVQEVFAVMLWERFRAQYGIPANAEADLKTALIGHHVDNGVLPYCGLACSKESYAGWPIKVLAHIDPSRYDACAAPMLHAGGAGLGRSVAHERARVLAMMRHLGISLEEATRTSAELTAWPDVYETVIDMIVRAWSSAAPKLALQEGKPGNVVKEAAAATSPAGKELAVPPVEKGGMLSLARHRDWAIRRFRTTAGEEGIVTAWGKEPSGARFDVDVLRDDGENRLALVTDGPWLKKVGGQVRGTFRLRLPETKGGIRFAAAVRMHGKSERSDGVTFRVELKAGRSGVPRTVFEQHTRSHKPIPVDVDLAAFAGQVVELSLVSDAGPDNHMGWDLGAWVEPRVLVTHPK